MTALGSSLGSSQPESLINHISVTTFPQVNVLVREAGVEPAHPKALGPKDEGSIFGTCRWVIANPLTSGFSTWWVVLHPCKSLPVSSRSVAISVAARARGQGRRAPVHGLPACAVGSGDP